MKHANLGECQERACRGRGCALLNAKHRRAVRRFGLLRYIPGSVLLGMYSRGSGVEGEERGGVTGALAGLSHLGKQQCYMSGRFAECWGQFHIIVGSQNFTCLLQNVLLLWFGTRVGCL